MPPKEPWIKRVLSFVPSEFFPLHDPDYPPPETFLQFSDTHLDENLILKRICVLPSLIQDFLKSVETFFSAEAQAKRRDGMYFFNYGYYQGSGMPYKYQAKDIRNTYLQGITPPCCQIASSILVHPDTPDNYRPLAWYETQYTDTDEETFYDENHILGVADISEKDMETYSDESQQRITRLRDEIETIALAIFLCPNAQWILEEMEDCIPFADADADIRLADFPWIVNSIPKGHAPTPSAVRPSDATNPLWKIPELPTPPTTSTLRVSTRPKTSLLTKPSQALPTRSKRLKKAASKASPRTVTKLCKAKSTKLPTHFKPKDIRPPPVRSPAGGVELLQRAWVKAVRTDTTVILFDCGNFLRIGIRHRETQTLFLTPLVDAFDPESSYGRLIAGLHLCIVHDALARLPPSDDPLPKQQEDSEKSSSSLKRKADPLLRESSSKRGRTAEPEMKETHTRRPSTASRSSRLHDRITLPKEPGQNKGKPVKDLRKLTRNYFEARPVIALYLQYGIYNSPTPQVLLAPDHPRSTVYKASTCLPVILTSKLGHGATGKVYTAILGPGHEKVQCSRLVVKLAVDRERLMSLRHEYDVYCHLQSAGVDGIPYIFGYYQDGSRGIGALVMHDVGTPLGRRMDADKKIEFSSAERSSLKQILEDVHSQGVLHRDLRSWNMMYNRHGEVSIIDFDRACLDAPKEDLDKEAARLARFLQGEFVDKDSIIGSYDVPSDIEERIMNI